MERLNAAISGKKNRPVKVVQFGEGNFLRAFADHMIDIANEAGVFDGDIVIVKPRAGGSLENFKAQDCQYTVQLRGRVDGEPKKLNRLVTSVADAVSACSEYEKYAALALLPELRFVISNTTEAGIVYDAADRLEMTPPASSPGKLTKFLYERYKAFEGAADKGLIMLPTELINDNGLQLKECVLKMAENWGLEQAFTDWLNSACVFASTLVDRIVTGYPKDEAEELWQEFGYEDRLLVTGEPFALWVIESPVDISEEMPLHRAGLPVIFTDDHHPYKERKVRILNGAHTSFVLASFLCGNDYVLQSMNNELILQYIKGTLFDEIIPTLTLPAEELKEFAEAVFARFNNPFVKHAHLAIAMNSVSKWRARCMPSLLDYVAKTGVLPAHLTFSLAALLSFYTGSEIRDGVLIGQRGGTFDTMAGDGAGDTEYPINDSASVLEFFAANRDRKSVV